MKMYDDDWSRWMFLVKRVLLFLFFLPTEAVAAGRGTECFNEEGARHLLDLLSDQPIDRHSTACLCCAQALCTKGPAIFTWTHNISIMITTFFLTRGFILLSFCSSPAHFSRVRQICVAVCAMRSSSAVTIDPAPPRRRQLLCCIFSWEKTLSLPRASV